MRVLGPIWSYMYHLLKGLHEYLTRKEEFSVIIIGLDAAGKTVCIASRTFTSSHNSVDLIGENQDALQ